MRTLRLFLGSVVVYLVVAACGAGERSSTMPADAGDAILDVVTDPVPPAEAGPLPSITATETCSHQYPRGTGMETYAEHDFAGHTLQQLASVIAVAHVVTDGGIPGYANGQASAALRDGYAAVDCGDSRSPIYDSVTFILPQ